MALDGVYLNIIKKDLEEKLIGSRVDKIHQPSREEIIITFRTRQGSHKVLFNVNASQARVHETEIAAENPKAPPMFCMLLRKHLSSGKLIAIRQDGKERILSFDFDSANEMGDIVRLTLIIEIMGRHSNLMLVNAEGKILDSIKRIGQDVSSVRPVLPGMIYSPPPREKRLGIFDFDEAALINILSQNGDKDLSKCLLHTFEGISPVIAREAVFYAAKTDSLRFNDLNQGQRDKLCFFFKNTAQLVEEKKNKFVVLKTRDNQLKDFCFTDILQYGSLMIRKEFSSPNELLDYFYAERDRLSRTKQWADDLFKLLLSTSERISRRISNQLVELDECKNREIYKKSGDLIISNIYKIKKGDGVVMLTDYTDPDLREVSVTLDKRLTPQQNAQKYYNEYKKCDTAEKMLTRLIEEGKQELAYIDSVFDSLTRATSEADILALREELSEQGYLKLRKSGKAKPQKGLPPLKFRTTGGFDILVGRNNRQNDKLTLKDSSKSDIWLHTKDIPGSHVILKADGKVPVKQDIFEAACIAAYHSKAKSSSSVGVDYTLVKNVKKPNGAKPGMVIFTDNKTLFVTPDEELIEELKVK
ncbi:MAG: NFACT family protein [Ruminococcus sp.]|nr:NFACT family protein [Ruminococcus sp.]